MTDRGEPGVTVTDRGVIITVTEPEAPPPVTKTVYDWQIRKLLQWCPQCQRLATGVHPA